MSAFLAAERVSLLVSLVPYLRQQDGPVHVAEVAQHFNVTPKQLRDAVRLIAVSGRPGEAGVYSHLDLFDIDWDAFDDHDLIHVTHFVALEEAPRMSNREAAAVLAGLGFLRAMPELLDPTRVDALIAKLGAHDTTPHVVFGVPDSQPAARTAVIAAIHDRKRLVFRYRREDGEERVRHVDPFVIEAVDGDLYLRAWCLERNASRVFRLDRMRDAIVTEVDAEAHPEADRRGPIFTPKEDQTLVTIEAAAAALPVLRDYLAPGEQMPQPDARGRAVVEVRIASLRVLARLVSGNAGQLRILTPDSARSAVADWARSALDQGNSSEN